MEPRGGWQPEGGGTVARHARPHVHARPVRDERVHRRQVPQLIRHREPLERHGRHVCAARAKLSRFACWRAPSSQILSLSSEFELLLLTLQNGVELLRDKGEV